MALPIYNGADVLAEAVESLLAQTFTDFELLLLDNASTDRTPEICAGFAARDRRVRYVRNDRNIGGGPNWNRAFELATPAPYFKWAAHDDRHAPRFLERCVEALDRDPGAVLAFTKAELIDGDGNTLAPRTLELPLSAADARTRFESILPSYDCMDIFGVMRREALLRARVGGRVLGLYNDGDGVLLARMTLLGRFLELPEVLFYNRRHATQAGTKYAGNSRAWAAWWDPANAERRVFPQWRRQAELWRGLMSVPLAPRDRLQCALALARWTRWSRKRLYNDVEFHVKDVLRSFGRAR
jgi:glycosyltransferase involved in cell wall biosynthesis